MVYAEMGILKKLAEDESRRRQRKLVTRAARGDPEDVWRMLRLFESLHASGKQVDRRLQDAVNQQIAAAVKTGKFPAKPRGAPPPQMREIVRQRAVARKLKALLSSGMSVSDAVEQVSGDAHRDKRVIYRYWKAHRVWAERDLALERTRDGFLRTAASALYAVGALRTQADLDRLSVALKNRPDYLDDLANFKVARHLQEDD